jgi:hypothetical protein
MNDFYSYLHRESSTLNIKMYILDPLSVIIKLAILAKKPIGTKIVIRNNIIYFHEPSYFQPLYRYFNNVNKLDLHYLYNPIQNACVYFLTQFQLKDEKKHERIQQLFQTAQLGIKNLIETYKSCHMIHVCLNYYYSMISNYLENHETSLVLFHKDIMTSLYTEQIVSDLHEIWNEKRLKIVLDLIEFLNDESSSENNVSSLEKIMQDIDIISQQIMSNV